VDQIKTSRLDAEARYTAFFESARAVITPETESSEKAKFLDHDSREIFTISEGLSGEQTSRQMRFGCFYHESV
jgi:hypothetical protein